MERMFYVPWISDGASKTAKHVGIAFWRFIYPYSLHIDIGSDRNFWEASVAWHVSFENCGCLNVTNMIYGL